MWLFEGLQINRAWYPVTLRPMISHVSCAKLRLPTYHLPLVCSTVVRTRTLVHFTSPNTIGSARKLQVKRKKKKKNFFLKLLLFPQHLTGRWVVNRCESSSAAKKKKIYLSCQRWSCCDWKSYTTQQCALSTTVLTPFRNVYRYFVSLRKTRAREHLLQTTT